MMARRIIAARRRAAGGDAPLLSLYPGAAAAYSLRDLTGLNPDLILVRRSTDNAEQALSASGISDGSLEAWCGSGDGFVRTWYDQSGNGNDATQATASSQPKIVDAGVLVTENGKAAIDFDGKEHLLTGAEITVNSLFHVNRNNNTGSVDLFLGDTITASLFVSFDFQSAYGGQSADQDYYGVESTTRINNQGLFSAFLEQAKIFISGQEKSVIGTFAPYALPSMQISGRLGEGLNYLGTVQELILYPSDQSANRVGIESNINDHYGIY